MSKADTVLGFKRKLGGNLLRREIEPLGFKNPFSYRVVRLTPKGLWAVRLANSGVPTKRCDVSFGNRDWIRLIH